MARVIEAEARVSAVDATGRTFEQIAQKVKGLQSAMKSLGGVTSSGIGNVNKSIGHMQRAISTLSPVAAGAAGYEGARGIQGLIQQTVKATAERAHEAVRMDVSGMSEGEIAEAERLSGELSERYRALSQTTIMHSLRNMRAIVGTYEEAAKILDPVLKLRVAAMGAHPERAEELAEDFDKLVKGMEIKGVTMDPAKFTSYLQGMAKAINVFGDTLRPTDYYEMFKYGRQATQGLDEKFMLETAPTLAQELGGSSAGKAISSFFQAIVGGRIKEQSVKEMAKLGLVNKNKVVRTKTGSIKGLLPGGIKGSELAAHDPYAWVNQVLLPAFKAHGITSPEAIQATIGTIFQQATAAQMAAIFATQQARIEKDWALVHGSKGLEAADIFQNKDPFIAMTAVTEQFKNLLAAAGSPLAEPAAKGLNAIADGIIGIENAVKNHPIEGAVGLGAAAAIGAGLSGYLSYLGLRGLGGLLRGAPPVAENLSGDAAIAAMQEGLPAAAGGLTAGAIASALSGYLIGPLGWLIASTKEANAGEHPLFEAAKGRWGLNGIPSELGAMPTGSALDVARTYMGGGPPVAEVKGDANLNIVVEPSDNFVSRIVDGVMNRINVFGGSGSPGTAGSTGLSMPQAVPSP